MFLVKFRGCVAWWLAARKPRVPGLGPLARDELYAETVLLMLECL